MSVAQIPPTAPQKPPHYSSDSQYQKYCAVNLSESAVSNRSNEKLYKIATYVAMIAAGVLLLGAVAAAAILLAPVISPVGAAMVASVIFVVGVTFYRRVLYDGIKIGGKEYGILHLKNRTLEFGKLAEHDEGTAKWGKLALKKRTTLTKNQANLIGRVWYWAKVAQKVEVEFETVQKSISDLTQEIQGNWSTWDKNEFDQATDSLSALQRKEYGLIAAEYIPAKVKAAYFLHICKNPEETREFTAIIEDSIKSYITSLELKNQGFSPPIFATVNDGQQRIWTISDLLGESHQAISEFFF